MKHTRKNKRFRKRKQTKRNNYRKKRPTCGGFLGFSENDRHKGLNGLLLDFNICGKREKDEKCSNKYTRPGIRDKLNDGFLNTGYNIEDNSYLSTEPFGDDGLPVGEYKVYKSYTEIYNQKEKINQYPHDAMFNKFLTDNPGVKILFQIKFKDDTNGVIIVKSYDKILYNTVYAYYSVKVDTDANEILKGQDVVDNSKIIRLYRRPGDLATFRNYK